MDDCSIMNNIASSFSIDYNLKTTLHTHQRMVLPHINYLHLSSSHLSALSMQQHQLEMTNVNSSVIHSFFLLHFLHIPLQYQHYSAVKPMTTIINKTINNVIDHFTKSQTFLKVIV